MCAQENVKVYKLVEITGLLPVTDFVSYILRGRGTQSVIIIKFLVGLYSNELIVSNKRRVTQLRYGNI